MQTTAEPTDNPVRGVGAEARVSALTRFMRRYFGWVIQAPPNGEALWVQDGAWRSARGVSDDDIRRVLER